MNKGIHKYIGTRQFYAGIYYVAMPVLIQNLITNFVSLLDNLMVGRVGTEEMSGVSIINQFTFLFIIGLVGINVGPGVLSAQFFGKNDNEGVANCYKYRLYTSLIFTAVFCAALLLCQDSLINAFLYDSGSDINIEETFNYAKEYLHVIFWGYIPYAINTAYANSLREIKETRMPMIAGVVAVFVNLSGNYILIYGKLGAPVMGVVGAAIATNISRIIELVINIIWTHTHGIKAPFAVGLYKKLSIPAELTKKIFILGLPMFINELLWALSQTMLNKLMAERGIEVVSSLNINSVVFNIFSTFYLAIGISISIILGNLLGAGEKEKAIDTDTKLIVLSLALSALVGLIGFITAKFVPGLYNTTDEVKELATTFIRIVSIYLPLDSLASASYFTLRSGGKTLITFLFDSCSSWVLNVGTAFVLVRYTMLPIVPIFAIVFGTILIKLIVGLILVNKKIWVNTLV